MITCPKCGCDTAGRGHKEETCLRRQLAQRTQERDEARRFRVSACQYADKIEAKLERIRVAARRCANSGSGLSVEFLLFLDAEFGKDGW